MAEKESFFKKIGNGFKKAWEWVKNIPWNQPVKPIVAWGIIGGVLAISVALMLIFWL